MEFSCVAEGTSHQLKGLKKVEIPEKEVVVTSVLFACVGNQIIPKLEFPIHQLGGWLRVSE